MSKRLHTDFNIGFEFEGFAFINDYINDGCDYRFKPVNFMTSHDGELIDEFYDNITYFINDKLMCGYGYTHYDGSLKDFDNGYQSFEYSSSVIRFKPNNLYKIKKFFHNMNSYGFEVNNTCGFHTHISWDNISEEEAIWVIVQIANNQLYINEFSHLIDENLFNKKIEFKNEKYASEHFLIELNNAIYKHDIKEISDLLNSKKYRLIRIHPQGTLEWRGPRNFLNENYGIDIFIKKLYKVIDIIKECLDKKELNGISKKQFFKELRTYKQKDFSYDDYEISNKSKKMIRIGQVGAVKDFNIDNQSFKSVNICRIERMIVNNPKKLEQIKDMFFGMSVISELISDSYTKKIYEYYEDNNILDKMPQLFKKMSLTSWNDREKSIAYDFAVRNFDTYFRNIDDYEIWFNIIENTPIFKEDDSNGIRCLDTIKIVPSKIKLSVADLMMRKNIKFAYFVLLLIEKGYFKNINVFQLIKNFIEIKQLKLDTLFNNYSMDRIKKFVIKMEHAHKIAPMTPSEFCYLFNRDAYINYELEEMKGNNLRFNLPENF